MKLKRIAAGVVGAIAVLASLRAFLFAAEVIGEALRAFKANPGPPAWREFSWEATIGIIGVLLMFLAALLAGRIGLGLLRFAWTGWTSPITGRMRPVLLGFGFFFPGFVFSLPLTLFLASRAHLGEQWDTAVLKTSLAIGLVTAITSFIVLFRSEWLRWRQ